MEAKNRPFNEEAYQGIQDDLSLYFDALLSRAEDLELASMRAADVVQKAAEMDARLAAMHQVSSKTELLRTQTIGALVSSVSQLDECGEVLSKLQRFQTQFDLSPSAIAALQEPLGPKFGAAYDEIAQLINSPDFDAIYQRAHDQSATLFRRLQDAQQLIIQHFTTHLETHPDPRALKALKKQFQFCRVFGAKTGSLKLHAVFGMYEDGLRLRAKRLGDKLEELAKFPFLQVYQPSVAPQARRILADFNIFMPQLTAGSRRSLVEQQVMQSPVLARVSRIAGFHARELGEQMAGIYVNSFLFSATHAGRHEYKEVSSATHRPAQQGFLGSLLQTKLPRVTRAAFDQGVYPEHVLAQILRETAAFALEARQEFQDVFGTRFRFGFDALFSQLKPSVQALVAQLDFVGACSYYAAAGGLAGETQEQELKDVVAASRAAAAQKLLLYYKQVFANSALTYSRDVDQLLEAFPAQAASDERLSGTEADQAKVAHLLRELVEQDASAVPHSPTLAFRAAALLETLRLLQGTELERLHALASQQLLQFVSDSAPKLFQHHRNPPAAAFAFATNFAAVLSRAGVPVDLEAYYDQLRFAAGGAGDDLLAPYALSSINK